jgi:hypothetical protein
VRKGGFLIVSDVFGRSGCGQGQPKEKLQGPGAEGPLVLKEFVARMILAGVRLPDPWRCRQGQEGKKTDRARISYFLLVARKGGDCLSVGRDEGAGKL